MRVAWSPTPTMAHIDNAAAPAVFLWALQRPPLARPPTCELVSASSSRTQMLAYTLSMTR